MSNIDLVTFLDSAQRTIIGERVDEGSQFLTIKNPVVVNIVPQYNEANGQPTGQMSLQLLPVYFKEFQGEKKNPAIFKYTQTSITPIEFEGGFDFRLYAQYSSIFANNNKQESIAANSSTPTPAAVTPTLKLFEE